MCELLLYFRKEKSLVHHYWRYYIAYSVHDLYENFHQKDYVASHSFCFPLLERNEKWLC